MSSSFSLCNTARVRFAREYISPRQVDGDGIVKIYTHISGGNTLTPAHQPADKEPRHDTETQRHFRPRREQRGFGLRWPCCCRGSCCRRGVVLGGHATIAGRCIGSPRLWWYRICCAKARSQLRQSSTTQNHTNHHAARHPMDHL